MCSYFTINSCVRGYHIYQSVWTPLIGELLICQTEFGNPSDPYTVAVMYNNTSIVIGHVLRHISTVCHFFLRRNGNIICQVTEKRSYSLDLVQGRLEIPCTLTFSGTDCNVMTKVQKLIEKAHIISPGEPASKKVKLDDFSDNNDDHDPTWLSITGCLLTTSDKAVLLQNEMLNDKHIYFS